MATKIKLIALLTAALTMACAGVAPGEDITADEHDLRPEQERPGGPKEDSLIDPNCRDTAPTSAPMTGAVGPAARITSMRLPTSMREATALGCPLVAGSNGGQGLTALMRTVQIDVDTLVNPDASGVIPSIILGHLVGWQEGQSGNETTNLDLHMYKGIAAGGDTFRVDPASMDAQGQTLVQFPAAVGCQALETEPARIDFNVPIEEAQIPLTLEASQVSGRLSVDETGINVTEGRIVGYVPLDAIVSIVAGVQASCQAPNAPMACANAGILLEGDAEEITRSLVLPFLYGLDARLSADRSTASPCEDDACNAMSVCIAFEAESVNVQRP